MGARPHTPLPGYYTRLTGMQNLLVLHAKLIVSLSVSKCSPVLCISVPLFHTRMIGQYNLSVPHAKLMADLSVSKCSHILCLPALLQRAIPE